MHYALLQNAQFSYSRSTFCINILLISIVLYFFFIDFFRLLLEWHSKFGDTYQLWIGLRPFIAMADADHIQVINKFFIFY